MFIRRLAVEGLEGGKIRGKGEGIDDGASGSEGKERGQI
jgi:hypothetical protein